MKNNHNAENMMRVEDAKAELDKAYSMERKGMLKKKSASLKQHMSTIKQGMSG